MTADAPGKRPAYEPAARLLSPVSHDPDMPRPASTVAGAVLVLLRVVAGVVVLFGLAMGWNAIVADPELVDLADNPEAGTAALWLLVVGGAVVLVVDLVLAIFIFRGSNVARVLTMIVSTFSICSSFVAWWAQGQEITLQSTFVSLALDILILLALSSRTAAAYARRNESH